MGLIQSIPINLVVKNLEINSRKGKTIDQIAAEFFNEHMAKSGFSSRKNSKSNIIVCLLAVGASNRLSELSVLMLFSNAFSQSKCHPETLGTELFVDYTTRNFDAMCDALERKGFSIDTEISEEMTNKMAAAVSATPQLLEIYHWYESVNSTR